MLMGVLKAQGTEAARIGIITSRRVGGAVQRNGVRRRIREIARAARPQLVAGLWMVIIAKHNATAAEYSSLREEWTQLARKAGCFHS
jgi:ribonuclease P protein component